MSTEVKLSDELAKAHHLLTTVGDYLPVDERPEMERFREAARLWSDQFPIPEEAVVTQAQGFPGLTVTAPASRADRVLLYFFGGGYNAGEPYIYRGLGARLATAAGAVVHLLDYPLAPENRFPAALDSALAAYKSLLATVGADRIAVAGDSAGGGLTLALMLKLKQEGIALPAAIVPISPWTDQTVSAPSYTELADRDPFVSAAMLQNFAAGYLGDHDPKDPLVSPLFGELSGLPPIHIEVGTEEVMIDDSRRFHEKALAAGNSSELVVMEGAPHNIQLFAGFVPEAADSVERIAAFVRKHIS